MQFAPVLEEQCGPPFVHAHLQQLAPRHNLGLHSWELVDTHFYPKRGGGGGLFFPLPAHGPHAAGSTTPPPTHMLQSDFHQDGTAYYALGVYDATSGKFLGGMSC